MSLVFERMVEVCRDRGYPCSFSFGYRMDYSDAVIYKRHKQVLKENSLTHLSRALLPLSVLQLQKTLRKPETFAVRFSPTQEVTNAYMANAMSRKNNGKSE